MGLKINHSFSASMATADIMAAITSAAISDLADAGIEVPNGQQLVIDLVQVRKPEPGFRADMHFAPIESSQLQLDLDTGIGETKTGPVVEEEDDVGLPEQTPETALVDEDADSKAAVGPADNDPVFT